MLIKKQTLLSTLLLPESFSRRKLNALYREIPLSDHKTRTMQKYFCAMANLYGCISLKDAFEIITQQTPTLITEIQFISFAKIARHECEHYLILSPADLDHSNSESSVFDWEIICRNLVSDDFLPYLEVVRQQAQLPFYIPEKTLFFKYADPL